MPLPKNILTKKAILALVVIILISLSSPLVTNAFKSGEVLEAYNQFNLEKIRP